MAELRTDYKDQLLDLTANQKRKYRVTNNEDGTISLDDVSIYSQIGDEFGAEILNAIVEKIKERNVRYNNETDYLDVFFNGTWHQTTLKANAEDFIIYDNGDMLVPLGIEGFTHPSVVINEPIYNEDNIEMQVAGHLNMRLAATAEKIDCTKYNYFNVTFIHGNSQEETLTLNISSIDGEKYLSVMCVDSLTDGESSRTFRIAVTSNKDVASTYADAYVAGDKLAYETVYVKKIWLE